MIRKKERKEERKEGRQGREEKIKKVKENRCGRRKREKLQVREKNRILSLKSEFYENSDPENSKGILQILKSEF